MKKLLVIGLAGIIAMTSVLSSCGDKAAGSGNNENTATPKRDENSVAIWWATDGTDYNIISDAWYDFKKAATTSEKYKDRGYTDAINMFTVPGDIEGTSLIEMQIAAGTAPDLIRMDHVYVTKLGYGKKVFDLNEKFNADETIKELFTESCWDASSYKDPTTGKVSTYGIPFDANTIIWGGKSQHLKAAGVSLPKNYQELLDAGNKLKALNLDIYPYTLPCGTDTRFNWPAFVFMFYVWRLGGDVLSEDLTKAVFNDPTTGVEALQMMIDMGNKEIISKEKYQEGESVLCDYGTWKMNDFKEEMEFSLLPELKEGVKRYSGLGLYDLSIVSTATNPQLAYDFAVHFATEKSTIKDEYYQYTYTKSHNVLPSLKAASQTSDYKDATKSKFWQVSIEQLELSRARPSVPCWPEIEEVLSKAVTQAISGEKDPAAALNAAANQTNELLAKYYK